MRPPHDKLVGAAAFFLLALASVPVGAAARAPVAVLKLPGAEMSVELLRGTCKDGSCPVVLVLKAGGAEKDRLSFGDDLPLDLPDGRIEAMDPEGRTHSLSAVFPQASAEGEGGATMLSADPLLWAPGLPGLLLQFESVVEAEGLPCTDYVAVAVRGGRFAPAWRENSCEMAGGFEGSAGFYAKVLKGGSVEFSGGQGGSPRKFVLRWDAAAGAFAYSISGPQPPLAALKLPAGGLSVEIVRGRCKASACTLSLVLRADGKERDRLDFTDDRLMDVADGVPYGIVEAAAPAKAGVALNIPPLSDGPPMELHAEPALWGPETPGVLLQCRRDPDGSGNPATQYAAVAVRGGKFSPPWRGASRKTDDDILLGLVDVRLRSEKEGTAAAVFSTVAGQVGEERGSAVLRWDSRSGRFVQKALSPFNPYGR